MSGTGLLIGLAAIVLLIACLNIANMLLARGSPRRREIAPGSRGANRGRIVRQLLTESLTLAFAGAGLGFLCSVWASRWLASSFAGAFPFTVNISTRPAGAVLLATVAFAAFATITSGRGRRCGCHAAISSTT